MENLYEETKKILKDFHITANKNLGQNFLINEEVVNAILESSEISKQDLVIEIGPGLGTLTSYLLEKAGKVIAIEVDKKMVEVLKKRFIAYSNIKILEEDVLKLDLNTVIKEELKSSNLKEAKVVANLPYYITTPIIMKLLEEKLELQSITVMIQKEVANRLTAIPSQKLAGAITYTVFYYAQAKQIMTVPKESFVPEPEVTSEVIQLKLRQNPIVQVKEEELFFKIIKQAFMQRRKTFINALSSSELFSTKEEILEILEKLKIDPKIRGEALTIQEFAKISDFLSEKRNR